ncbi:MAG: hypothetical protein V1773_01070 [bacterium]
MEDDLNNVKNGITELNTKMNSLTELLNLNLDKNILSVNDLNFNKINYLKDWVNFTANTNNGISSLDVIDENKKTLLFEIKEIMNALNYDVEKLKGNVINTDDELKTKLESINNILLLGNNSIRERIELWEQKQKIEEKLDSFTLEKTSFENMGFKGRLNVNNVPYDNVPVKPLNMKSANIVMGEQIKLTEALNRGYNSVGYVLSSSIANAVAPFNKVNSLAQILLNTFIEVTARALIFKTLMGGFNILSGGVTDLFGGSTSMLTKALPGIQTTKNIETLFNNNVPLNNRVDVNINIPKIEFKQTGYDLKAVINKVEKSMDKYQ